MASPSDSSVAACETTSAPFGEARRERRDRMVSVCLPQDLVQQVIAHCGQRGLQMSDAVTQALAAWLDPARRIG